MIVEIAVAAAFAVVGAPFAVRAGATGWGLAALSALLGAFVYLGVGALQVLVFLPTYPLLTLCGAVLAAAVAAWPVRAQLASAALWALTAALASAALAAVAKAATLIKWSADSMMYLAVGGLLATDRYHDVASGDIAFTRLLGVGLLHAPAHLDGSLALFGITPVLAASALATSVWLFKVAMAGRVSRRHLIAGGIAIVALTLAANRMVFTAFYVNGHVVMGAAALLLVAGAWLTAAGRAPQGLLAVCALAIPAAVVTRPDAPIVLGVMLIGVLAEPRVLPRDRALLLGTLGVSTIAWNAYVVSRYHADAQAVPLPVYAQLAGGAALAALAFAARRPWPAGLERRLVRWSGIALATATAAAFAARPAVAAQSVRATFVNLAARGGWSPFLPLLMVAIVAILIVFTLPEARAMWFAILSFPAVALILAVGRDGAYRVGPGDSLNRSWAHVVPLAILVAVVTVLLGRLRPRYDSSS